MQLERQRRYYSTRLHRFADIRPRCLRHPPELEVQSNRVARLNVLGRAWSFCGRIRQRAEGAHQEDWQDNVGPGRSHGSSGVITCRNRQTNVTYPLDRTNIRLEWEPFRGFYDEARHSCAILGRANEAADQPGSFFPHVQYENSAWPPCLGVYSQPDS